jgi:predicted nucleic acid-binding protein
VPAGLSRSGGVLPDSCAWIDYFRGAGTGLGKSLELVLHEEERVFTCGNILCELLQGVRSEAERSVVLRALGTLEYAEMEPRTWMRAGALAADLQGRGRVLPHSDLLIAAVALDRGLRLLTADRHFHEVPGVVFFERSGDER